MTEGSGGKWRLEFDECGETMHFGTGRHGERHKDGTLRNIVRDVLPEPCEVEQQLEDTLCPSGGIVTSFPSPHFTCPECGQDQTGIWLGGDKWTMPTHLAPKREPGLED